MGRIVDWITMRDARVIKKFGNFTEIFAKQSAVNSSTVSRFIRISLDCDNLWEIYKRFTIRRWCFIDGQSLREEASSIVSKRSSTIRACPWSSISRFKTSRRFSAVAFRSIHQSRIIQTIMPLPRFPTTNFFSFVISVYIRMYYYPRVKISASRRSVTYDIPDNVEYQYSRSNAGTDFARQCERDEKYIEARVHTSTLQISPGVSLEQPFVHAN